MRCTLVDPARWSGVLLTISRHQIAGPERERELSERSLSRICSCMPEAVALISPRCADYDGQRNPPRRVIEDKYRSKVVRYSAELDCYEEWMVMRDKYFPRDFVYFARGIDPADRCNSISRRERNLTPILCENTLSTLVLVRWFI